MTSLFDSSLFKAYDIRGIYPAPLSPDFALALGRIFGSIALKKGEKTVAVGRDGRISGPELSQALMQGLQEAGIAVLDLGMVTTPQLYFVAKHLCSNGIQITGSHNPKDYNGFKMVLTHEAIFGESIQTLRHMMEAHNWQSEKGGSYQKYAVQDAYQNAIVADIKLTRPLKVVIDCGNGVAGATAPTILRAIGCEVHELFSEVDGNFPNHHPDPSKPENLTSLIQSVIDRNADVGLALDGDGDRLGVVTRDGQIIYPDRQLMLFAQDLLAREPHGTIVFDVKCSQQVAPFISAHGGVPLMYKTGHSLIKTKMKEIGAKLGGEMSGHIFFFDRWGFDDGTYAACRLLEILSRTQDPSAMLNALPQSFNTPELNIACAEGQAPTIVQQLITKAAFPPPAVISTIDGLRVDWADGFGLIRSSNTTPALVLRFEGQSPQALKRIQTDMLSLLKQVDATLQIQGSSH